MVDKVVKSEQEWMQELTPEQFQICRSERAGTGKYNNEKRAGTYNCVCCGHHCLARRRNTIRPGWPVFQNISEDAIVIEEDLSYGMRRSK